MLKKLTLMSVLGMLCLNIMAQSPPIKPLSIGDTVPDMVFNHVINYKDTTARLSDFKGKLVILDFWATWCGSCLQAIPKADSLQFIFKDSIQIVLVNPKLSMDSLPSILKTLKRLQKTTSQKTILPIVFYDEIAFSYFPFRILPHYVWINKEGIVKAISSSSHLTENNIKSLLMDIEPDIPLKKD